MGGYVVSIHTVNKNYIVASGGLSQEFVGSGQNQVTAKKRVRAGSSHSTARNITVFRFM